MQSKVMYLFLSAAGGRQWWHVCSYTLPITFFSTLFNLPKFFEFTTVRVQGRKTDADKKTRRQQYHPLRVISVSLESFSELKDSAKGLHECCRHELAELACNSRKKFTKPKSSPVKEP